MLIRIKKTPPPPPNVVFKYIKKKMEVDYHLVLRTMNSLILSINRNQL